MDQEGHAEAMSTEHKRTEKVYMHHITKGLSRVRLGVPVLVDKPLHTSVVAIQAYNLYIQLVPICLSISVLPSFSMFKLAGTGFSLE